MLFGTEGFEFGILNGIHNALQCDFMDFLMKLFSAVGDAGVLWIIVAVAMLCSKKYRRTGVFLGAGLLLGLLFGNLIVKNLVARPRPCWIFDIPGLMIEVPKDYSFPSGHTLSSFIAALVLLDSDWKIGIPAAVIAVLIAFSRLYLFVHFPTDILGGIILAILVFSGMKIGIKLYKDKKRMI